MWGLGENQAFRVACCSFLCELNPKPQTLNLSSKPQTKPWQKAAKARQHGFEEVAQLLAEAAHKDPRV